MEGQFVKNLKIKTLTALAITSACAMLSTQATAAPVLLPTANCNGTPTGNCLQANDFNVFSLALLDLQNPNGGYNVSASPGQIAPYTIIGQNNGQEGTGNLAGFVDGTYNTPSPNSDVSGTFSTVTTNPGGVADPKVAGGPGPGAGEFTGDVEDSWDARVNTITQLTNGTPVVFFFSFNETGSNSGLLDTDLLIWGKVTLVNDTTNDTQTFYLGGEPAPGTTPLDSALPPPTGPDTDFTNLLTYDYGPWIYVHAGICVNNNNQFVGFPDNTGTCTIGQSSYVQTNLGNDTAAFMINSPALDAALLSGDYDTMQVTWEMAYINGGGESAWIAPVTTQNQTPEPGLLALTSLGLSALAWNARRTRRTS